MPRCPELGHLLDAGNLLAGRVSGFFHADNVSHLKPDPRAFDGIRGTADFAAYRVDAFADVPGAVANLA